MDRELRRQRRMAMRGVPERLALSFAGGGIEMRAKPNGTPAGSNFEWRGYAAVYNHDFPMWDPLGEPYTESVAPGACRRSLANPALDVPFLIGHNDAGVPLARTKSGTMTLSEDTTGLHVHVPSMDGGREEVRALASAVERGDLDEMSLAFVCLRQEWDDAFEHRTVAEMDIHRGDVCAVVHGANAATAGASMFPVEQLSFRRPAAIGGPHLLEFRSAASLAAAHGHPGRPCVDPDGDGDCDATPAGDTDHDYWTADGKQIKPLPGQDGQHAASAPYELLSVPQAERRASAEESLDLSSASDYDAAAAGHAPGLTCPQCKAGNHGGAKFCSQCGHNFGTGATVTVDDATGVPGEEVQMAAARKLELLSRELELEELAAAR